MLNPKDLKGWTRVKSAYPGKYKMINGYRCEIRFISPKSQYAAIVCHGAALLHYSDKLESCMDAKRVAAEVAREFPPMRPRVNPDKFDMKKADVVHVPEG